MNQRTTASILLDEMVLHGIDTLYCLPGVQNDDFFDTLYDYPDRIRPVHVRHEQAAGYMALGAAMATGRPPRRKHCKPNCAGRLPRMRRL